jgi:hypothetical protein
MPGEERKFRRRRIVAFPPGCKRERDLAESQAVIVDGVSPRGVDDGSSTGVPVGVGSGVAVCVSEWVAVGEGRGVAVSSSKLVAVGEGIGSVDTGAIVRVGDATGMEVDVSERDVEVAGTAIGFAARVTEGVDDWIAVAGSTVDPGVKGTCRAVGLRSSSKNRIKSRLATINLKIS